MFRSEFMLFGRLTETRSAGASHGCRLKRREPSVRRPQIRVALQDRKWKERLPFAADLLTSLRCVRCSEPRRLRR